MPVIKVRGVEIDFPYKPYDCQVNYMSKVIECLQEGKNGILESPTGTGKTLCLLCATLAWRDTFVARLQLSMKVQENKASGQFCDDLERNLGHAADGWMSEESEAPEYSVPKIIYTSRTHSQLTQVVNELKNTVYKPKVCVLGSRDQLCIHPQVLEQETHTAKRHLCRTKVLSKTCHYYNMLERDDSCTKELASEILDIEDLVGLGKKESRCPYFMSRKQRKNADIVFMPYNYLIDAKSRQSNDIDISKSIIIFDEAHNIEQICEAAMSFDLTSFDIASCIEDLDKCLDTLATMEEDGTLSLVDDAGNKNDGDLDKQEVAYMKGLVLKLEEELHTVTSSSSKGITHPGSYIFELLAKVKITRETHSQVVELIEKVVSFSVANQTGGARQRQFHLSKFADALKVVFRNGDALGSSKKEERSRSYKVHVQQQTNDDWKRKQLDVWSTSKAAGGDKGYSLGYWCFSPGETMKDLMKHEVRCMILTSGTLSPLDSFKSELQIDIPVELQNPHVIKKHQMFVGILKTGPDSAVLNSSYKNRNNVKYLTSLGIAIVNFAQVVPDGMLVFFPSYGTLDTALKHWQSSGLWNRLETRKTIFVEPRRKNEFTEAMEGFYEKVRNPENKGAVFLAVCRGKVSEGVDFSDINGRAVVITGLPYPPAFDPKVELKKQFLNEVVNKREFKGLNGQQWYGQQASRAVNQAIGRVLRHKEDYGAILFCDERFCQERTKAELPKWMKPYICTYPKFGDLQRELRNFFRRATELCDSSCMKVTKVTREETLGCSDESKQSDTYNQKPLGSSSSVNKCVASCTRVKNPTQGEVVSNCNGKKQGETSGNSWLLDAMGMSVASFTEGDRNEVANKQKDRQQSSNHGLLDTLDAHEAKMKTNLAQKKLKTCSKSNSYSPVVEEPKHTAVNKKKLKITRPESEPQTVEAEKEKAPAKSKDQVVKAFLTKVCKRKRFTKFLGQRSIKK
ncbi:regulator of telomere elongation helicase 1-like [Dendronephthya gigantea]|uniref:regulator of telomere elongation helicase 1-like n=1 Tax=Dendronephthya gigantea TaxID=151771 RepID=UPI00106D6CA8|nr:regulator of telomere elongation helicase 1-like [Dendronephthya gigantea]